MSIRQGRTQVGEPSTPGLQDGADLSSCSVDLGTRSLQGEGHVQGHDLLEGDTPPRNKTNIGKCCTILNLKGPKRVVVKDLGPSESGDDMLQGARKANTDSVARLLSHCIATISQGQGQSLPQFMSILTDRA